MKLLGGNYTHQGFGSTERPPSDEVTDMKFCVTTFLLKLNGTGQMS